MEGIVNVKQSAVVKERDLVTDNSKSYREHQNDEMGR